MPGTISPTSLTISADTDDTVSTVANASPGGSTGNNATTEVAHERSREDERRRRCVSAALAFNFMSVDTEAYVASENPLVTLEIDDLRRADAHTGVKNVVSATADGSTVQTLGTGVGVGVAINATLSPVKTKSWIDRVILHGTTVTIEALAPAKSSFTASAKSGAGATSIGVAGSFALNVVTADTTASPAGDPEIDANLVLTASSNLETNATSEAKETGGSTVGIGASVSINVVNDTTTADVQNGVTLDGVNSLTLTATSTDKMTTSATSGAAAPGSPAISPSVAISISNVTTSASVGTGADLSSRAS